MDESQQKQQQGKKKLARSLRERNDKNKYNNAICYDNGENRAKLKVNSICQRGMFAQ